MSKKEKKINKVDGWGEDVQLDIPDDEVWTYQIPGLAAPHINKPHKNYNLKKIVLTLVILVAVSVSMYFSLGVARSEVFDYTETEQGIEFSKFSNNGYIKELDIDYVSSVVVEKGNSDPETNFTIEKDTSKPITSVREFALNCDEKVQVINIGETVLEIDGKSFYSCWGLREINVDENNPNYCSVDGVLYNKDKTKIICVPTDHDTYLAEKYGYAVYHKDGYRVEPDAFGYKVDGKVMAFDLYTEDGEFVWSSKAPEGFNGKKEEIKVYNEKQKNNPRKGEEIKRTSPEGIKVYCYYNEETYWFFGTRTKKEVVAYEVCDLNGNFLEPVISGFKVDDFEFVPLKDNQTIEDYEEKVFTFVVPSSVETVGELCFNYANMKNVYLPEGLKSIEDLGFYEIPRLENIYTYVPSKEITSSLYTSVAELDNLYLSLPEGLEYIGSDAFTQCQALTYMYVPSSVKTIEHHAFWDTCYKQDGNVVGVNAINVGASEEEFNSVETGDNWRPQYDYLLFKKSVDINYSATRQELNNSQETE